MVPLSMEMVNKAQTVILIISGIVPPDCSFDLPLVPEFAKK